MSTPIQVGERYVRITDDPWDDSLCEVIDVKAGWVKYGLCFAPEWKVDGPHHNTSEIGAFLTRWKLQPVAT
jgi:hypothetical protein